MHRKALFVSVSLLLCGCASTQLNYNTLDLASTTDHLLKAQILHNLAQFIDSPAAIPAQVVMNGGTTTTANTISPQFTDPLSRAVTLGGSLSNTASSNPSTQSMTSISSVMGAKSVSINGSNVATQNWAFEPVIDPDQLRRLYVLYRFAVQGNQDTDAQTYLILNYPLPLKATSSGSGTNAKTSIEVDSVALRGPNCVLCDPAYTASQKGRICLGRPELTRIACLIVNPRLLPAVHQQGSPLRNARWLKWKSLPGAHTSDSVPPPYDDDLFLGQRGLYLLYVDKWQVDRFAEFSLFVETAATTSPNPWAGAGASGAGGTPRPKGAIATPTGILLSN
jgi:hypothetical protein